ncbi:MAG: entericidin A/B family lipoprotein [Burkholderiales bacterium]
MKKIAVLFSLTLVFALAGCNTVKGVGQDVQKAGSVIEDSVKKK